MLEQEKISEVFFIKLTYYKLSPTKVHQYKRNSASTFNKNYYPAYNRKNRRISDCNG